MPFGVTPVGPTIPRTPPEFSEFIQFQSDGDPLSGPTVQVVNILSPLTATRGVGENAHVVTISRPDIPFIFVSLTGVQAAGEVGDVESDPPLFYVPFTGDVADDVTANPAPATVGATAVISGNAFLSINPVSTTSGISWTSAKLQGLTSGDFTMSGTFKWAAIAFASFRRIMRLDFGNQRRCPTRHRFSPKLRPSHRQRAGHATGHLVGSHVAERDPHLRPHRCTLRHERERSCDALHRQCVGGYSYCSLPRGAFDSHGVGRQHLGSRF